MQQVGRSGTKANPNPQAVGLRGLVCPDKYIIWQRVSERVSIHYFTTHSQTRADVGISDFRLKEWIPFVSPSGMISSSFSVN